MSRSHPYFSDKLLGGDPFLWPFSYDTVTISAHGLAKLVVGAEASISINLDMKAWRERGISTSNQAMSISLDSSISVGASAELAGGLSLVGSDGSVGDQRGINIIGIDGVPAQAILCKEFCIGAQSTIDPRAQNGATSSMGYFLGAGEGLDLSVDLVQFSDWIFYVDPRQAVGPQLPFLNRRFLQDVLSP